MATSHMDLDDHGAQPDPKCLMLKEGAKPEGPNKRKTCVAYDSPTNTNLLYKCMALDGN